MRRTVCYLAIAGALASLPLLAVHADQADGVDMLSSEEFDPACAPAPVDPEVLEQSEATGDGAADEAVTSEPAPDEASATAAETGHGCAAAPEDPAEVVADLADDPVIDPGAPEKAADPQPVVLADASDVVSDDELDTQRGGLATPLGFDIGFGATVKTFVDGTLALETRLTWTQTGIMSEEVVNDLGSIGGPPVRVGAWNGSLNNVPGGATVVLHDVTADRIASLVVNTANNRTIRQETDITLVLPQMAAFEQQIASDRVSAMLQSMMLVAGREAAMGR